MKIFVVCLIHSANRQNSKDGQVTRFMNTSLSKMENEMVNLIQNNVIAR